MRAETKTKATVKLGHIPYFITHWGVLINLLLFGLFVVCALFIKYPEVVVSRIGVVNSGQNEMSDDKNSLWIMNIPDSLSCYAIKNSKVNIAVNKYPTEEYGYLTGYIKYSRANCITDSTTNLVVVVENTLSNVGKRIEVDSLCQGEGLFTIYRVNLFHKLFLSRLHE